MRQQHAQDHRSVAGDQDLEGRFRGEGVFDRHCTPRRKLLQQLSVAEAGYSAGAKQHADRTQQVR